MSETETGGAASPPPPRRWKRNVTVFLASQALSLLGSSLVQYAIIWRVILQTKSGSMMTLMVLATFLPSFFLSPFAGVFADRHDRKRIILASDATIALVTLALAFVYRAGVESTALLFAALAFRAAGQAFQGPAVGAILPQMAAPEALMRINALNGSIQSALSFVSPMLAGLLLSVASLPVFFFLDVATAAAAIFLLVFFLPVPPHAKALGHPATGYLEDLRLGFRYVRSHRPLGTFFVYLGLVMFLIAPSAFLTPLQTARSYGAEVWRLTALDAVFSLGMIAGGVLLAALGGFRNRMTTILASALSMSVCAVFLGLGPPFWLYLVFMGLFGAVMPAFNTPFVTLIQERVEEDFLGRVFSLFTMLSSSMMPLGMLVFGPLGDLLRIEWLLAGSGAAMGLVSALAFLNRGLRELGKPAEPPPASALGE